VHWNEIADEPVPPAQVSDEAGSDRVMGSWRGLFVAAYVTELEGVFYGYAKVYEHRPADPWCADALLKVGSSGCPCPAEALDTATERACGAIDAMLAGARHMLWRQLALRTARRMWAAATNLFPAA
jgi:hypothetical protein